MAIIVFTDASLVLNSVNLSDHIKEVSLNAEVEDLDSTVMGTNGWHSREAGLKDGSITVTFLNDFASSSVDSTIWSAFGTKVAFVLKPTSGAVSATNPSYSGTVLVNQHTIGAQVGQLGEISVTFPTSGAVTRATS